MLLPLCLESVPSLSSAMIFYTLFNTLFYCAVLPQDNLELVELPESYTELYGRAQSPHASAAAAAAAAEGGVGHDTDPAVCLVCGQVRSSLRFLRLGVLPWSSLSTALAVGLRSD